MMNQANNSAALNAGLIYGDPLSKNRTPQPRYGSVNTRALREVLRGGKTSEGRLVFLQAPSRKAS